MGPVRAYLPTEVLENWILWNLGMLGDLVCFGLWESFWISSWHQHIMLERDFGAFRDKAFLFSPSLEPSWNPYGLD